MAAIPEIRVWVAPPVDDGAGLGVGRIGEQDLAARGLPAVDDAAATAHLLAAAKRCGDAHRERAARAGVHSMGDIIDVKLTPIVPPRRMRQLTAYESEMSLASSYGGPRDQRLAEFIVRTTLATCGIPEEALKRVEIVTEAGSVALRVDLWDDVLEGGTALPCDRDHAREDERRALNMLAAVTPAGMGPERALLRQSVGADAVVWCAECHAAIPRRAQWGKRTITEQVYAGEMAKRQGR